MNPICIVPRPATKAPKQSSKALFLKPTTYFKFEK